MDEAQQKLFLNAISCDAHWKMMHCPILFLGASNDFNSPTENVIRALMAVPLGEKRLVLAAHYNHSFDPASSIADVMWFEDHLKGTFKFPKTPASKLQLTTADGVPVFQVKPDPECKLPIAAVNIYQSTDDAYAKDNVEGKSGNVTKHICNLRWEGGESIARPKHYKEG